MSKFPSGYTKYYSDRLVTRYRLLTSRHDVRFVGKRVSKNCELTREEIRMYVEKYTVSAVKLIMQSRDLSLTESVKLLNKWRHPAA